MEMSEVHFVGVKGLIVGCVATDTPTVIWFSDLGSDLIWFSDLGSDHSDYLLLYVLEAGRILPKGVLAEDALSRNIT